MADAAKSRAPRTILLADDQDPVRSTVKMLLESQGYTVTEAVDGVEAVERYLQTSPRFQAVLLDVDMPGLDGVQAMAKIREHDPEAPIILVSGAVHDLDVSDAVLLPKPFASAELIEAIRRASEQT